MRQGSVSPGYLRVYNEIDIASGHISIFRRRDNLRSTLDGRAGADLDRHAPASRNSAALLSRFGLSDMAVQTSEQYVARAVAMANDLDRLAALRKQLRDRMATTLCNGRRFTRVLEDAYRTMWRRWCGGRRADA